MRSYRDGPWEVWALILCAILLVAMPLVVGALIIKLYRKFKPIEKAEVNSLASLGESQGDGFLKIFFVGWVVCGPVFYWLYTLS